MCLECPPEVRDLARAIGLLLARHGFTLAGGLHIVIEDGNTESEHIQWCIDHASLDAEQLGIAQALLAQPAAVRHAVLEMGSEGAVITNGVPGFVPPWE